MRNKLFVRVFNCCSAQRGSENGLNVCANTFKKKSDLRKQNKKTRPVLLYTHSVQVEIHTPDTFCVSDK